MDEMAIIGLIRAVAIFASVIGVLAGLDLLLGARVVSILKEVLDKAMVNLDKTMITTKARIIFGVLFLVLSLLMLAVIFTTKGV
ncbi:MAG: hypothetical protein PHR11_01105 [Candidatus Omnitrophica bacterium]|nr:hypothetical protein [Candidatus Omnitrophota bacterium]